MVMLPAPPLLARIMRARGQSYASFTVQYGIYYTLILYPTLGRLSSDLQEIEDTFQTIQVLRVYELV